MGNAMSWRDYAVKNGGASTKAAEKSMGYTWKDYIEQSNDEDYLSKLANSNTKTESENKAKQQTQLQGLIDATGMDRRWAALPAIKDYEGASKQTTTHQTAFTNTGNHIGAGAESYDAESVLKAGGPMNAEAVTQKLRTGELTGTTDDRGKVFVKRNTDYKATPQRAVEDLSGWKSGKAKYEEWAKSRTLEDNKKYTTRIGWLSTLSEDQLRKFYALYDKDPETAWTYSTAIVNSNESAESQRMADFWGKNVVTRRAATLLQVPLTLMSGLDYIGAAVERLTLGETGKVMSSDSLTGMKRSMLSGAAQGLQEKGLFNTGLLSGTLPENIPVLGGSGLGDLYQTGTSMVNSYAAVSLGGRAGTIFLAGSAASDAYYDALQKGATDEQALLNGLAQGIAEALFEYVSLDHFIKLDIDAPLIKNVLKQAGVEAGEEANTSIANYITDSIIMKDKSEWQALLEESDGEKGKAFWKAIQQVTKDSLAGFISGGGMAGGSMLINSGIAKAQYKSNLTDILKTAQELIPEKDVVLRVQSRLDAGKSVSGLDVLRLTESTKKAMNEQVRSDVKSVFVKQLNALGETGYINGIADALTKELYGEKLTKSETRLIESSDYGETFLKGGDAAAELLARAGINTDEINPDTHVLDEIEQRFVDTGLDAELALAKAEMLRKLINGEEVSRNQVRKVMVGEGKNAYRGTEDMRTRAIVTQLTGLDFRGVDSYATLVDAYMSLRKVDTAEQSNPAEAFLPKTESAPTPTEDIQTQTSEQSNPAEAFIPKTESAPSESEAESTRSKTEQVAKTERKESSSRAEARAIAANFFSDDAIEPFIDNIREEDELLDYVRAFGEVYNTFGKGGVNIETARQSESAKKLGDRFETIYNAGKSNAAKVTETTKSKPKGGTVSFEGGTVDGKTYKAVDMSRLSRQQKAAIEVVKTLAEKFGINFVFYQSEAKNGVYKGANGIYKNNTIYLDVNAGRNSIFDVNTAILRSAAHELTHYIQQYNDEAYEELKDFISKKLLNNFSALVEAKKKRSSEELTESEAIDEVVADACEMMLKNSESMQMLAEENAELAGTVKGFLNRFLAKLRKAMSGVNAEHYEARKLMDDTGKYIDGLQEMWDKALVGAVKATEGVSRKTESTRAEETEAAEDESEDMGGHQFSTRSFLNAAGLEYVAGKDKKFAYATKNGVKVTSVTAKDIINSPLGNLVTRSYNNGYITKLECVKQYSGLAGIVNLVLKYDNLVGVWDLIGTELFSAIKSNADTQYSKTIDFSTVCKKTQAIIDAMSAVMLEKKRGLTRKEVERLYFETALTGESVPCPVCYVFSRWMGVGGVLDAIDKNQERFWDDKTQSIKVDEALALINRVRNDIPESKKLSAANWGKNGFKYGKVFGELKEKYIAEASKRYQEIADSINCLALIEQYEAMIASGKMSDKEVRSIRRRIGKLRKYSAYTQEQLNALREDRESAAEKFLDKYDDIVAYQFLTVAMFDQDKETGEFIPKTGFKPVSKDVLFDLNAGDRFAKGAPDVWKYRTTRGAAMGKAILPYSDARLGEIIQGVALSKVQDIKKAEDNPFLNGDTKAADEALEAAIKNQRVQNLLGGMRYQSASDFRYEYGSDYLMSFLEMQAIGANVQLYTKVIEAVDFLAGFGADCNLSVMPLGNGIAELADGTKQLVYSEVTGINAEAAIAKSRQYDNVQLILVGISDEHIRLALEGTDVTFVIPFHGSGNTVHQIQALMQRLGESLDLESAQDYEAVQNDHDVKKPTASQEACAALRMKIIMGEAEQLSDSEQAVLEGNKYLRELYNMFYIDESSLAYGVKLGKKQAAQVFPYEYWDKTSTYDNADINGERFKEYCASIGKIPRFSGYSSDGEKLSYGDFSNDKGYWKLLIDRPMYANVYDDDGNWIGYGKYRAQKRINISDFEIDMLDSDLAALTYGDAMSMANDPEKTNIIRDRMLKWMDEGEPAYNIEEEKGKVEAARKQALAERSARAAERRAQMSDRESEAVGDVGTQDYVRTHQDSKTPSRTEMHERLSARAGKAQYALRDDAPVEIHKAVTDKNYGGDIRLTDTSPSIMLGHKGVKNLPMLMKASHIRENILSEDEAKKLGLAFDGDVNFHGLGEDLFKKVIDSLDDITVAYRGTSRADNPLRRENCFLLLSTIKDSNGDTIIVPVYINETGDYNRVFIKTNKIASVYGKSGLAEYIRREINKGNLVGIKKRGPVSSESPAPIAVDYADVTSAEEAADQTAMASYASNVPQSPTGSQDLSSQKSDRDSEGNKLSEGQQEFFRDSKVRDADGNLLKVYHNTNNEFTVFNGNGHSNFNSRSVANWFTDNEVIGKTYAPFGRTMELYINVTRPLIIDAKGKRFNKVVYHGHTGTADIAEMAKRRGYDGVIFKNIKDYSYLYEGLGTSTVVAAFDSNQSKLTSNLNPTEHEDTRFSDRDTEYLELAKDPEQNRAELQAMVDEAAREAGYDTPKLYHGTEAFGFTVLDTQFSDDELSFFATDDELTARSYLKTGDARDVGVTSDRVEDLIDFFSEFEETEGIDRYWLESVMLYTGENQLDDEEAEIFIDEIEIRGNIKFSDTERARLSNILTAQDAGIYQLYARTANMLSVEGNRSNWNSIPLAQQMSKDDKFTASIGNNKLGSTRQISLWAYENGYSGVIFKNIRDDGGKSGKSVGYSTVYSFFDPQSQVKSADPVTYDDEGNVIPLSERFNESNEDIRYSDRETYAQQVDAVRNNTHDRFNHVYMGTTPTGIAKVLELPKLPMLVTPNHVYSMAVSEATAISENRYNRRSRYHDLGWAVIKKLPELIDKPVMIIKSNTDSDSAAFIVVCAETNQDGVPIFAVISPNGKGNYYNLEVPNNFMLSSYGKDGFRSYIAKAKTENRILYVNEKNSRVLKNTKGVQFSNNILASDYSKNLSQFKEIVKRKFTGTMLENNTPIFSERDTVSDTELLSKAGMFDTKNAAESKALQKYKSKLEAQKATAEKLEESRRSLEALMNSDKPDAAAVAMARGAVSKQQQKLDDITDALNKLGSSNEIQTILRRKRNALDAPMLNYDRYASVNDWLKQSTETHDTSATAEQRLSEEQNREVTPVPKRSPSGMAVSKTLNSIVNSPFVPDDYVDIFLNEGYDDWFSYFRQTDKAALRTAQKKIDESSWQQVYGVFKANCEKSIVNKNNTVTGIALLNSALSSAKEYRRVGNKQAEATAVRDAIDVAILLQHNARAGAQSTQAMNLLGKLSPETMALYVAPRLAKLAEDEVNNDRVHKKQRRKARKKAQDEIESATKEAASETGEQIKGWKRDAQKPPKNETVFTFEYIDEIGKLVADGVERIVKRRPPKTKTLMEELSAEVLKLVSPKQEKAKGKSLTATDRLRDYIENIETYSEAWSAAQDELRRRYADDAEMTALLDSFTNADIDFSASTQSVVLFRAIADTAIKAKITPSQMLARYALVGSTSGIANEIAEDLIRETGAEGNTAEIIRLASERYVAETIDTTTTKKTEDKSISAEALMQKTIDGKIREAMKSLAERVKQYGNALATTGRLTTMSRSEVREIEQGIVADLMIRYDFTPAETEKLVNTVHEHLAALIAEKAQQQLSSMFNNIPASESDPKAFQEQLTELMRMGAFEEESFAQRAAGRLFGDVKITIDPELQADYLAALESEDEALVTEAYNKLLDDIAAQMPSTWRERAAAWRYLSMLGNIRTHVRNIAGNAVALPLVLNKQMLGSMMERLLNESGERTKALLNPLSAADRQLFAAAWQDYTVARDLIMRSGKYNDAKSQLQDRRTVFRSRVLEEARKLNFSALELEDSAFAIQHYAIALSGYLKANGITAEQFNESELSAETYDKARAYAVAEAQKATYRDANDFSDWVAGWGRRTNSENAWERFGSLLANTMFPFKRTPANILVRAFEYSPVGLIKSISYDINKVRNNEMSMNQLIDGLAGGLTGTMVVAVGFFMAVLGFGLNGSGSDDDDKEKAYNKTTGWQAYSIRLPDGTTVGLDWAAPTALPFLVGVQLYEKLRGNKGETTLGSVLDAITGISEPVFELSMLSGLKDAFDAAKYADDNTVGALALQLITNYVSQWLPTLSGQVERITEPTGRVTMPNRVDNNISTGTQKTIATIFNKVPGIEAYQVDYIDMWGRKQSKGSVAERIFNNLFNPAKVVYGATTSIDNELARLYDLGNTGVYPSYTKTSVQIDGEYLTPDQYTLYATQRGQESFSIAESIISSPVYQKLTDKQRADAIETAYNYATQMAQKSVNPDHEVSKWMTEVSGDKATAIISHALGNDVSIDGKALTNEQYLKYEDKRSSVESSALANAQKSKLYSALSTEQKDKVESRAKTYASEMAKKSLDSSYEPEKWTTAISDGTMTLTEYTVHHDSINSMHGDDRKDQVYAYISKAVSSGTLTVSAANYLWVQEYPSYATGGKNKVSDLSWNN